MSFVKSLTVSAGGVATEYRFATPDDFQGHVGAVSVICGENGAGKSFLIRALDGLVSDEGRKAMYSGYDLLSTNPEVSPRIIRIEPWNNLSFSGQIFFDRTANYKQSKDEKRLIPLGFWTKVIGSIINRQETTLDQDLWMRDHGYRRQIFNIIDMPTPVILSSYIDDSFIVAFEEMFSCNLGLRIKSDTLEITMDTDFGFFPFQNWSQGQKTIFNTLQIIAYSQANVFLFDEIENNLHPASISKLLRRMKNTANTQFIITSHHPHVIFSRFADLSLFIERVKPTRSRRGFSYENEGKKASIPRKVYSLAKSTEKFRATYQLFDSSDAELLEQATSIRRAHDAKIYTDIFQSIGFQVLSEKVGPMADSQTQHMSDIIQGLSLPNNKSLTIFDYGSGLCRVVYELGKIYGSKNDKRIKWIFWEPNVETRQIAQSILPRDDNFVFLRDPPKSLNDTGPVDLMLITNVIHELPDAHIVDALALCHSIIGNRGHLIINELYPLLEFEETAIPFRPDDMRKLLIESGFLVDITASQLRSTTAYSAVARSVSLKNQDELSKSVRLTFQSMLRE